ncbi:MAG: hypothetical protein KDD45_11745 [Bdellovibrionales bacterium]|nr:hypothetical protein [Bdellovibrionales bacterium]
MKIFNQVPMYAKPDCKFSFQDINPQNTYPLSESLIREYKIKQIKLLNNLLEKYDFNLYDPLAIILRNGEHHYIVPPVLEIHDSKLIVAEGHTRLFIANNKRVKKIRCVVIEGVGVEPISPPTNWNDIETAPYGVSRDFVPNEGYLKRLRKIEKYMHMAKWYNIVREFK